MGGLSHLSSKPMKPLLIICSLLLACNSLIAQDKIDVYILNKQFDQALTELEQQLATAPSASLWYKQGLVFEYQLQYESAIDSYRRASTADPLNALYLEKLAEANQALGNYTDAVNCFKLALELEPANLALRAKLAQSYMNLKQYPDAFTCYQTIWEADSTNAFFNRYYAYSAYRVGKGELARKLYLQLLDKHSRDLNCYLNLATIYGRAEKADSAAWACDRGLEIFPGTSALLTKKGDILFNLREYKLALQPYEELIALGDSSWPVLKNYGICLYFDKQEEQALDVLGKCYEVTVNDPIVNFYMGACFKKLKDFEMSSEFLEWAIETATPSYLPEIYHHLGQVYGMLREFKKSVASYQKALELDPNKHELLFQIASTYEEFNSNKAVALHYYREYLKAVGDDGTNSDLAYSRVVKIKEELFFEEGQQANTAK